MKNHSYLNPQKAAKLLELNKLLTQSLKLEEVLENVIMAASELVKVSDTFIIYLYDESDNKLRLAEGKGIDKESLQKVSFSPGESIAGKVFRDREPKLFLSENEIDDFMSNMSEENYRYYYEGIYKRKIKSAFCVPIVNKNRCLGVLVVDNFKQDGIFTDADMQVIHVLAEQSAIAIDNSNVYQSLKEKNDLLAQGTAIHNKFYQLIIEGGGIDKIVSLLESIIGSKVVHHSTDIYEKNEAVFSIVRGNEVLGVLELEKPIHTFTSLEQIVIEQASLTIAIELMKDNALLVKELQFREEVFNQLIEGISDHDLRRILNHFQWDEKCDVQCMVVEGEEFSLWHQDKLKDKEWFVRSIEEIVTIVCGKSLVLTRAFQLIMVFPAENKNIAGKVIKNINAVWGTKKRLLFGVGRETSVHHIATSYKEAIRSVSYGKTSQDTNIVEYAKLGIERLLHEADGSAIEMFMWDKIGTLLHIDHVFLETLKTYIEHNKNHKETAAILNIHVNTLYYRLKKIKKLLEIDFNDEKEWLDVVIAIRLYVASNKN